MRVDPLRNTFSGKLAVFRNRHRAVLEESKDMESGKRRASRDHDSPMQIVTTSKAKESTGQIVATSRATDLTRQIVTTSVARESTRQVVTTTAAAESAQQIVPTSASYATP